MARKGRGMKESLAKAVAATHQILDSSHSLLRVALKRPATHPREQGWPGWLPLIRMPALDIRYLHSLVRGMGGQSARGVLFLFPRKHIAVNQRSTKGTLVKLKAFDHRAQLQSSCLHHSPTPDSTESQTMQIDQSPDVAISPGLHILSTFGESVYTHTAGCQLS